MSFSDDEIDRYSRHLVLQEIGGHGQQRLKAARVLVVGAGGLGCPAALYLAAAGVGAIGLVDPDTIANSNLQRQILYTEADVGKPKATTACLRLNEINSYINFEPHNIEISPNNACDLISRYDLIVDGTDNFATRFLVNSACHDVGRPLISGAISRWTGQIAIFESGLTKDRPEIERKACYRCLVHEMVPSADTCERLGVIGALAGMIGSLMALEAIKYLIRADTSLSGRLMIYDALSATTRTVTLPPHSACPVCSSADCL